MHDGRNYASWQSGAAINENLRKKTGIKQNWEYRKYLTENSQQIARDNFREACNDVGYFERFAPDERGYKSEKHDTPSSYLVYKDQSTIINENSDLKNLYLTREELSSRYEPVTLTQEQLFSKIAK